MGYVTHADKVLKILTENPGKIIYRDDVAEDTGLTLEQVTIAMNRIMKLEFAKNIDIAIRGRAWAYHPNRATVIDTPTRKVKVTPVEEESKSVSEPPVKAIHSKTFELIGHTANKETLVKDEKGIIYKVVPL